MGWVSINRWLILSGLVSVALVAIVRVAATAMASTVIPVVMEVVPRLVVSVITGLPLGVSVLHIVATDWSDVTYPTTYLAYGRHGFWDGWGKFLSGCRSCR